MCYKLAHDLDFVLETLRVFDFIFGNCFDCTGFLGDFVDCFEHRSVGTASEFLLDG